MLRLSTKVHISKKTLINSVLRRILSINDSQTNNLNKHEIDQSKISQGFKNNKPDYTKDDPNRTDKPAKRSQKIDKMANTDVGDKIIPHGYDKI